MIPVQLFDNKASIPRKAHETDAGFDLCSTESLTLKPFERATVGCGLGIAIPDGMAGLVIPRSGLASKHGISIVNAPGLIDSGYRGEVAVVLVNLDQKQVFEVHKGDRIAQFAVVPMPSIHAILTESLPESERGTQGFGSSGI